MFHQCSAILLIHFLVHFLGCILFLRSFLRHILIFLGLALPHRPPAKRPETSSARRKLKGMARTTGPARTGQPTGPTTKSLNGPREVNRRRVKRPS